MERPTLEPVARSKTKIASGEVGPLHMPPNEPDNAKVVKQALQDDIDEYPCLDAETQQAIVDKYRHLHRKIKSEGYYECQYGAYAMEVHQIMFTAHDAGHQGISHNYVVDTLIGMFIADFCCGLSIGWWKSSHNVHHLVTNHHASNLTD
ncbi:MAG: hypothetical protein Q9171_004784 [Xanthocarpia ochracea]